MSWVIFTADHIRESLAVRELAIYEETASVDFNGVSEDSAGARIDSIASRVADQFRGIIRANQQVISLGPVGSIPGFCLPWAIAIARVSMLGLNPVEEGRTDPRRDEYTDATKGRDSLSTMNAAAFSLTDTESNAASSSSSSSSSYGGSPFLSF